MKNSISKEHSEIILRKMCDAVGIAYEDMDLSQPEWYYKHSWKMEEENQFIKWLAEFLIKHKYAHKKRAEHEAMKIVSVYGWKVNQP